LRTSLNASSFVVAQLVCTMSFESDDDLELYPHVELELRAESRRSSREATAQRSAAASRVLVVRPVRTAFGANLGRTMRLFVM
jgi:hypothetical protein